MTRCLIALLIAVLPLAGLAAPSDCWIADKSTCGAYVGHRLWVLIPASNKNVIEVTFTRHDWATSRTLKLRTGASFLVTAIDPAEYGSADYRVRLNDGRSGWVATSSVFLVNYDPVARAKAIQEECARRGQPKIGMTSAELVATCWRKPSHIVKRTTAAGVEEDYIYGIGRVVKINNGKISEIIESR